MSKIATSERDLLKTNEDIYIDIYSSVKSSNLQTSVWWVASLCPHYEMSK